MKGTRAESYLVLGEEHLRLWRRPGETGPDIQKKKFRQKLLICAGFALGQQSPLVILRHKTINGDVYVDACLQEGAMISGMDQKCDYMKRTFMLDIPERPMAHSQCQKISEDECPFPMPENPPEESARSNPWNETPEQTSQRLYRQMKF
jgi:hypothetical protein